MPVLLTEYHVVVVDAYTVVSRAERLNGVLGGRNERTDVESEEQPRLDGGISIS